MEAQSKTDEELLQLIQNVEDAIVAYNNEVPVEAKMNFNNIVHAKYELRLLSD